MMFLRWVAPGLLVIGLGVLGVAQPAGAASPDAPPLTITIDEQQVVQTVSDQFSGTNFVALWNPTGDSPGTVRAFSQMGLSLMRFPGGVPAQFYDWEKPLDSGFTELTPQRAWNMAKAAGAELVFQTNIANDGTNRNKSTGKSFRFDSSGAHQAGWVKFAKDKGMRVAFWEVGNEPETDAPDAIKKTKSQDEIYKWYNAKYAEQVKAIRQVDPEARVMGPAATNTWYWWHEGNLEKFLKAHGNKQGSGLADVISLHWYIEGDPAWEKRRGAAQDWQGCMDYINSAIAKYDSRKLPVYITEWNAFGGMNNDSAAQLACALADADVIGMFLRTGVQGHMHFCLQRIDRNWGVLALPGERKAVNEPSPTYFALAMTSQLGPQVLKLTNPADERNVLSAYATKKEDGSLQVLLINKSDRRQSVSVAFRGYQPQGKSIEVYTLRGIANQITDTDVIYNGVRSPKPATQKLPAPKTVQLTAAPCVQAMDPYSIALLVFPADQPTH